MLLAAVAGLLVVPAFLAIVLGLPPLLDWCIGRLFHAYCGLSDWYAGEKPQVRRGLGDVVLQHNLELMGLLPAGPEPWFWDRRRRLVPRRMA